MIHLPYQLIQRGMNLYLEERNNPVIQKAYVRDLLPFGITLQTEEYDGIVYMKNQFNIEWKLWTTIPNENDRKEDHWKN